MKTNFTTLKKNRFLLPILISVIFLSCEKKREAQKSTTKTTAQKSDGHINLFEKLPESTTGINFSNNLKEDVATIENLFDFDYFYNGGGVGIADLNNDGLPDIFFTGNQVENKLYLNKGNLSFEDISAKANINNGKVWSNGVTFVDINNDGFLDIYVSQGGPKQSRDRKNLLFINQQDLTFTEEAETYGLADTGIGTQSVFFDLDNDGDLDCYVSNENELYGNGPTTFFKYMQIPKNLYRSSGHLYENTNGKFTDITKKAGVLLPSFGLGVAVSDINNDGWLDIYVAN
ncbi:MAG: FG-GAP repeat domain-containing protein, partial [Marinirhabdus sp.]